MGNATSSEAPSRPSQRLSKFKLARHEPQLHQTDDSGYFRSHASDPALNSLTYEPHDAASNVDHQPSPGQSIHQYVTSQAAARHDVEYRAHHPGNPELPFSGPLESQNTDTSIPRRGSIPASHSAPSVSDVTRYDDSSSVYPSTPNSPIKERIFWNDSPNRYAPETAQYEAESISSTRPEFLRRLTSSDSSRLSLPVRPRDDRGQSPDSGYYVPLRRKSTNRVPGVATRIPREPTPSLPTILNSTIEQAQSTEPEFRSNTPAKQEPTQSWAPRPQFAYDYERAGTPEMDYGQLGAIKLGALRVMNGSPVPSYRSKRSSLHQMPPAVIEDAETDPSTNIQVAELPATAIHPHSKLAEVSVENLNRLESEESKPLERRTSPMAHAYQPQDVLESSDPLSAHRFPKHLQPGPDPRVEAIKSDSAARSDSDRGSTTSSASSRQMSAKADSGYGSNISLTSLKLGRGRRSSAMASVPATTSEPVVHEPEIRSKKRSSWLYGRSSKVPSLPDINQHRRHKSSSAIRELSMPSQNEVFLSSVVHNDLGSIPAIPVTVERSLRQHEQTFPVASRRLTLRNEPSKETLKTILSIDSAQGSQQPVDGEPDVQNTSNIKILPAMPAFVKDSLPKSWLMNPGKPITRKPVGSKSRHSLQPAPKPDFYKTDGHKSTPYMGRQSYHGGSYAERQKLGQNRVAFAPPPNIYGSGNGNFHCVSSLPEMDSPQA